MTEEQKAKMAERRAARRAMQEAKAEQEKKDRVIVLDALRAILRDPEANTSQRVFALCTLDEMQYYRFVPYELKHFHEPEVDKQKVLAYFAEKLEAAENK